MVDVVEELGRQQIKQGGNDQETIGPSSRLVSWILARECFCDSSPDIDFSTPAHYEPSIRLFTPHEEVVCRLTILCEFVPTAIRATVP